MKRSFGLALAFGLLLGPMANLTKATAQAPAASGQAQSTDKTAPSYDMKAQSLLDLRDMQKKFTSLARGVSRGQDDVGACRERRAFGGGDFHAHGRYANYGIPNMMGVKTPERFQWKGFRKRRRRTRPRSCRH